MRLEQIIRKAQDLIRDPRKWIQGDFAQTSQGKSVPSGVPVATRFCAAGSLRHVSDCKEHYGQAYYILAETAHAMGFVGVMTLNDYSSHAKVMELFDRAYDKARRNIMARTHRRGHHLCKYDGYGIHLPECKSHRRLVQDKDVLRDGARDVYLRGDRVVFNGFYTLPSDEGKRMYRRAMRRAGKRDIVLQLRDMR